MGRGPAALLLGMLRAWLPAAAQGAKPKGSMVSNSGVYMSILVCGSGIDQLELAAVVEVLVLAQIYGVCSCVPGGHWAGPSRRPLEVHPPYGAISPAQQHCCLVQQTPGWTLLFLSGPPMWGHALLHPHSPQESHPGPACSTCHHKQATAWGLCGSCIRIMFCTTHMRCTSTHNTYAAHKHAQH